MKRLGVIAFGMTLSSPVLAIPTPPPAQIKSVEWVPERSVRIGDVTNALIHISMFTGETNDLWLSFNCRTQDKSLLFMDVHMNSGAVLRVYSGNSIARYTPATPFQPDADSLLAQDTKLNICHENIIETHWAKISIQSEKGDLQFVDVNNIERKGSILNARLATDYAKTHKTENYGAPFSMKIKDVAINCDTKIGITKASYLLDSHGHLTDFSNSVEQLSDLDNVTKALCLVKDFTRYQGNGPLVQREKPLAENQPSLPDYEHNDPSQLQRFHLPNSVTDLIKNSLASPDQYPIFSRLTYTQQWVGDNGDSSEILIDRQPDGTTLSLNKIIIANAPIYIQDQRLFNIVDLRGWSSFSPAPDIGKSMTSTFTIPVKASTEYQWHGVLSNGSKGGEDRAKSQICRTEAKWHSASELNSAFSGRYIELACTDDRGDKRPMSSDYAYMEDLRVFLRLGYHEDGEKKRFKFTDVVVTP